MEIYSNEWAENYEKMAEAGIPGREGLYRLCRLALLDLPETAHLLIVGCGTGSDFIPLAKAFPSWTFEAVEPAAPMMKFCKHRLDTEGLASRVKLHNCTLNNFEPKCLFDGATSILVSQHISDLAGVKSFFSKIYEAIKVGGLLYTADIHIPDGQNRELMLQLWEKQALMSNIPSQTVSELMSRFQKGLKPRDGQLIEQCLSEVGFERTAKAFSSLIYGSWICWKTA